MFWFGRKSAGRAPARPVFSHVYAQSATGHWPRSYEAQVKAGYMDNAIAQRAVRLVAEGVASAPVAASDPTALALLSATSGGQALIETVATHLLLNGNAYVEKVTTDDGALVELYALRPELMRVDRDASGWPMGFTYQGARPPITMASDRVIHIRAMHPLDDHYGLGCLGAASGAIATHNAATQWNKALLDNAARPSGALVADGEPLTSDQFDRLKAELAEGFQGAVNAGRPLVLEGGIKWQSMAMTPADMDFIRLKENAAREIALAFGVPPMLLGLPGDATYANYREANKALWRQAVLPLATKVLNAIAEGLQAHFPGVGLSIDLDHVPALSEDRERLWAQVTAADFLDDAEKRAILGIAS